MEQINLNEFCVAGVTVSEEYFSPDKNIQLKLITFTPEIASDFLPVIFIPGWISLINGWKAVLREMTKNRKVYYLETREKSSSIIEGDASQSIEAVAADIVKFLEYLQLKKDKYILFGSSLGATVILEAAKSLNNTPLALVLIGPNAEFFIPLWGRILIRIFPPGLYGLMKPFIKWYLKHFRLNVKEDRAQNKKYNVALDLANPYKLKKAALAYSKYTVWDALKSIKIPVLIFGGKKDKLHEPELLEKIIINLANVKYIDLLTNAATHSIQMNKEMDSYISSL